MPMGCGKRGRLTADFSAWTSEQQRLGEETSSEEKITTDNERTLNAPAENGTFDGFHFRWNMWAFHCNAECEFLFLAGLIVGRTSFLSLEALLSHKKSVFKESKRKTKERERKK